MYTFQTELLDKFYQGSSESEIILSQNNAPNDVIGIRHSSFRWSNDEDGMSTPGTAPRNFTLRIEDEVTFRRGHINLIVGPTGSGQTSLLMALLGKRKTLPL